jgi:putative aminotransferase|nr:DegT/DnrJ/EryC1/StrS family aminotransferase [uncultured Treponema sp.]
MYFIFFSIRCEHRDALQEYLAGKGVGTLIHYPIPPHKQECYKQWNHLCLPVTEKIHAEELSLPMSPTLRDEQVNYVVDMINKFSI